MNKLLHTPLTVHNVELANRLVMPPMATGKTPDGTVQDDLLAYYDARSKGGCIGLIVTEHAYISPEGKAHEGQLSVSRRTALQLRGHGRRSSAVLPSGAALCTARKAAFPSQRLQHGIKQEPYVSPYSSHSGRNKSPRRFIMR